MNGPGRSNWLALDEVESTQDVASKQLASGSDVSLVFAKNQIAGRGRLGRMWISEPGESLTMSLIFRDYADHPRPYLVGMATAIAVAGTIHSELRWPNDVIFGMRKAGGILTELLQDDKGRKVPVVGIGVNMNQREFPEPIAEIATSLYLEHGHDYRAEDLAEAILDRIALLPEPNEWADLWPIWDLFDRTPGKPYRLTTGELAIGIGVGSDGQLLCSVDGESRIVPAAEALFGQKGS